MASESDRTPSAAQPRKRRPERRLLPPLIPPHVFDGSVNQFCGFRGPTGDKCGKREADPIHGKEAS